MSEKLSIRNFGPLKEIDLELKPIMVFIGPQGSGKSLLARVIAMMKDVYFGEDEFNLTSFDLQHYLGKDSKIIWTNNQRTREMTEGKFTETLHGNIKYGGEVDLGTSPIYFSGERLLISNISGLTFNMIRNKVPLQSTLINFGALFEKARIIIPSFYVPFLKVTYKFESGEDRIYHSPSEFVPMRASATGYQATLPMILVIENYHKEKAPFQFIVDEPELSLYPRAQHELAKYLVNRTQVEKESKNELIITTHSPYLLSSLNIMLYAWITAQKFPEKETQIEAILPKQNWINPADFGAYYLEDGTITSIVKEESGLISENNLDSASDDIMDEFDKILALHRSKVK